MPQLQVTDIWWLFSLNYFYETKEWYQILDTLKQHNAVYPRSRWNNNLILLVFTNIINWITCVDIIKHGNYMRINTTNNKDVLHDQLSEPSSLSLSFLFVLLGPGLLPTPLFLLPLLDEPESFSFSSSATELRLNIIPCVLTATTLN